MGVGVGQAFQRGLRLTLAAILRLVRPSHLSPLWMFSTATLRVLMTYRLFLYGSSMLPGVAVILQLPQMVFLMALYLQGNLTNSGEWENVMTFFPFLTAHTWALEA